MKHLISITTAVVVFICLSTIPAQADRKTREGFLLGVGAAVLGSVIYQGLNQPYGYRETQRHHMPPAYNRSTQYRNTRTYDRHPAGRWEIKRIWVQPGHDARWKPDHHHRKGKWNNGRHEKFKVRDGYWKEMRVWIRN